MLKVCLEVFLRLSLVTILKLNLAKHVAVTVIACTSLNAPWYTPTSTLCAPCCAYVWMYTWVRTFAICEHIHVRCWLSANILSGECSQGVFCLRRLNTRVQARFGECVCVCVCVCVWVRGSVGFCIEFLFLCVDIGGHLGETVCIVSIQ